MTRADNEPVDSVRDIKPESPQVMLMLLGGMLNKSKERFSLVYTGDFAEKFESGKLSDSGITKLTADVNIVGKEEPFWWYLKHHLTVLGGSNFEIKRVEPFMQDGVARFEAYYWAQEEPYFTIELRNKVGIQ